MDDNQPIWKPTHVVHQQVTDPYGRLVSGVRVHYRVSDGSTGFIDIPQSEYNAQTVQDKIHTAVLKHFQVMGLSGPPVSMGLVTEAPQLDDVIR